MINYILLFICYVSKFMASTCCKLFSAKIFWLQTATRISLNHPNATPLSLLSLLRPVRERLGARRARAQVRAADALLALSRIIMSTIFSFLYFISSQHKSCFLFVIVSVLCTVYTFALNMIILCHILFFSLIFICMHITFHSLLLCQLSHFHCCVVR